MWLRVSLPLWGRPSLVWSCNSAIWGRGWWRGKSNELWDLGRRSEGSLLCEGETHRTLLDVYWLTGLLERAMTTQHLQSYPVRDTWAGYTSSASHAYPYVYVVCVAALLMEIEGPSRYFECTHARRMCNIRAPGMPNEPTAFWFGVATAKNWHCWDARQPVNENGMRYHEHALWGWALWVELLNIIRSTYYQQQQMSRWLSRLPKST